MKTVWLLWRIEATEEGYGDYVKILVAVCLDRATAMCRSAGMTEEETDTEEVQVYG